MYFLWNFYSDGSARHSNIRAKDRIQPQQDRWCKLAIVPPLHILNKNIAKPPRVPRDAVFNSRSHLRAMLDCVERKNAIPAKAFPLLYDVARSFTALYSFCDRTLSVLLASLADFLPRFCN